MNKNKNSIILILLAFGIFFVVTGVSYALFSQSPVIKKAVPSASPLTTKSGSNGVAFDADLPKTEPCPLNGALYSKQQRQWWEKHRPLGVMIENHQESRPQSGLSVADVIYEAIAEGGITRFLAIFYCQDAKPIGPVRSARTYFLDMISEYGASPLYAHVGGANTPGPANALGQIEDYDWVGYNDLNQFSIGFPTFWRDYDRLGHTVATEHTMYSTTSKLWNFAAKSRKLTNIDKENESWDENFIPYTFKDEAPLKDRSNNQSVSLEFWEGYKDYFVEWVYDKNQNVYKRYNGGNTHIDKNSNKQLTAKNVVVLYMQQSNANDGYENNLHLLFKTKGTGKAIVFINGKRVNGTWRKDSRTSRTLLYDSNGSGITFERGTIWFEILPTDGVVTVS